MNQSDIQGHLSSKKCNYIVLGGGAVVLEYYLPAFSRLGWLRRILIVDSSVSTLQKLQQAYPDIRTRQEDFNSYLARPDIPKEFNAVIVALPNRFHERAVRLALDKGFHVLCEKPLSLDKQSCVLLGDRAKERGKFLAVGMTRRLLPSVMALKYAIMKGMIGSIQEIDIQYGAPYNWLSETGAFFDKENGGVLADMGIHYLDMIQELIGRLEPVSYTDDCHGGVEANCEFILRSSSNVPVKIKLSRSYLLRNTAIIKGSEGRLILEKDAFDSCLWFLSEPSQRQKGLAAKIYLENSFRSGPWEPTLESAFAEELFEFQETISFGKEPLVDAYKASETVALIEWAYHHRFPISLNRENDFVETPVKRPLLPISKVLVTGGTGFIGQNLVARFAELGFHEMTVPVRNYKTCAEIARFPIKMPKVDLLDYNLLKKAIKGSRFVFHLAYGRDGDDAYRLTVDGTKNVVNAAIECGCESVVVLSTIYVFGSSRSEVFINESWPYRPIGEYGRSKAKMEKWCLKRAESSHATRIVVLNPSCVYGPGGKTYTELPVLMAKNESFCWIESGQGLANFTFVDNLVDAIFLAATCTDAHGKRIIVNDGSCAWKDFLGPVLDHWPSRMPSYTRQELIDLNKKKIGFLLRQVFDSMIKNDAFRCLIREVGLLRWMKNALFASAPSFQKKINSLPSTQDHQVFSNRLNDKLEVPPLWLFDLFGPTKGTFSAEKARQILGWEPLVGLEEGQRRSIAWLKQRIHDDADTRA